MRQVTAADEIAKLEAQAKTDKQQMAELGQQLKEAEENYSSLNEEKDNLALKLIAAQDRLKASTYIEMYSA